MNKMLFFGIIFLAILVACAPTEEVTEVTTTEQPEPTETAGQPSETTTQNTSTTPSVPATPGCIDSDNGLNTQFAGDVVDITGEKFYDKCDGDKTLFERKCGKDGKVVTSRVGCLYGCVDAACKAPPQEEETGSSSTGSSSSSSVQSNFTGSTPSCDDTDGGLEYDVQGTCEDATSSNLKDSCIGSDKVAEWSCSRIQDKCVQQTYSCNCMNGACQ